ncbi:CmpA/NrtA family ABC transporter substrate-binding protein [Oceanobacter sp. 3_MG-2023]|uniref:CmpA/NrtA family ABC transporter substrate-binding protein n=2 Tax=Gammaproteobacteria TaxID=1236 RepID=UPI0027367897|nr:CmpA/NrtA family ABC transporter substrate-binding protein [Oceanobacter sp. 3_MG-2023]MDP2505174.1 CmpA/NrtA family ABC transporter substrate-binding protein [Oceanobacter sp. 3_MG-2023]
MTDSDPLEKSSLILGYMPLSDSLPLLVADAQGYFAAEGLNVELQQEVSWANIRDKVLVGHLDGAQMLAPMLLATHLGLGGLKKAMMAPFAFGLNGNAFTISRSLGQQLEEQASGQSPAGDAIASGKALKKLVQNRRSRGESPLIFATVYPYSIHNLLLRDWLAASGVDPDQDVILVVLPPSQMVDHLSLSHIDGFCAGAPWNSVAIQQEVGECLLTGPDLWHSAPDKVLGLTQEWANTHPNTTQALIRALDKATLWLDDHREAAGALLADAIQIPVAAALPALVGEFVYRPGESQQQQPDMLVFHRSLANYPWQEHGVWFLQQMQRWGWVSSALDCEETIRECYRSDLYQQALQRPALVAEGTRLALDHRDPWQLDGVAMAPTAFSYHR